MYFSLLNIFRANHLLPLFSLLPSLVFCQSINNNFLSEASEQQEMIVQIALENNLQNIILKNESKIAQNKIGLSRWQWLDNINASFNANEYTVGIEEATNQNNLFFPKYNFRVSLNFGQLVYIPKQTQISSIEYDIAELNILQLQRSLRTEVLTLYHEYQLALSLQEIYVDNYEEAYSSYLLLSDKFKDGEASLEEYNLALIAYNESRAKKVTQETAIKISRLKLEEALGTDLDNALK